MSNNGKEKAKFRQTAQWKKFRKYMFKKSDGKDFLTGRPLRKGWQLHHLDMSVEHYKNLDENNFVCLNKMTHNMIHFIFRYDNYKEILYHASEVLNRMTELNKGENNATGKQED